MYIQITTEETRLPGEIFVWFLENFFIFKVISLEINQFPRNMAVMHVMLTGKVIEAKQGKLIIPFLSLPIMLELSIERRLC